LRIGTQRPAVEELSERAVGDAETNIHGLELFVSERPDATSRFNWGQRCEERVDRARVLRRAAAGLGRRRRSVLSSSPASTAGARESAATATESTATATKSATTPKPSTTATKFAATAAKFATAAAAEFTGATAAAAHVTGWPFACAAILVR